MEADQSRRRSLFTAQLVTVAMAVASAKFLAIAYFLDPDPGDEPLGLATLGLVFSTIAIPAHFALPRLLRRASGANPPNDEGESFLAMAVGRAAVLEASAFVLILAFFLDAEPIAAVAAAAICVLIAIRTPTGGLLAWWNEETTDDGCNRDERSDRFDRTGGFA